VDKVTILIIDDNKDFQRLMELRLRSFIQSPAITVCQSGQEALELLHADPGIDPDLVILDHHLPDGTGPTLLQDPVIKDYATLSVSSDDDPEIVRRSLTAGAAFFLSKARITDPSFKPLVLGLIDRNRVQRELIELRRKQTVIDTVRTLVDTLRHEINNPLGAVLGAAYILKTQENASADAQEAARLVEESGRRIKYVLDELTKAVSLDEVMKASHKVFQIPGDKPWEGN